MAQEHFPNLPKTPPTAAETAAANAAGVAAAAARTRAAKSVKMMYLWIGLATVAFAGMGYWGMLRPSDSGATDAVSPEIIIPGTQTPEQRAQEEALTEMVKRMKEMQESRVLVLEGPRPPAEPAADAKVEPARSGSKDFIIKFTPSTRPSTRPTTIGGRTKPFLAPDVAEDGSFFGQIDKATGKPKTVYSSNLRKYVVDSGMDFAERDASGSVIQQPVRIPSAGGGQFHEPEATGGGDYLNAGSNGRDNLVKNPVSKDRRRRLSSIRSDDGM